MNNGNELKLKPAKQQFVADNLLSIVGAFILLLVAGYDNYLSRLVSVSLLTLLLFALCYKWFYMDSISWICTNEQLIYIRGIFNKQVNYIELYRIFDYRETQTFLEQFIKTKKIVVYSGDKSHPKLALFGIKQNEDIVKIIRERVEINKQIKHIYEISNK